MSALVADDLARALLRDGPSTVRGLVDNALDSGVSAREVCLTLLAPALNHVGNLWQIGEATVAEEHLATAIVQAELARLAPLMRTATPNGKRILLSSSPGELHSVGLRMVGDFLEGDGWEVLLLGQSTPADSLAALVEYRRPNVVGLSTALSEHLTDARVAIEAVGAFGYRPLVIVGGPAYDGDGQLARQVGADAFAPDAEAASNFLRSEFG